MALGKCPREKIFKAYEELELQLGNVDRSRSVHEKFIELYPESCAAWTSYAELEANLEEAERARGIYELAIVRDLDMPELAWKAYIDFEISMEEYDRARELY